MKASMSGAAATFAALPTQMARLLAALEQKQASEAPAGAEAQDAAPPAEAQDAAPAEAQDAAPAEDGADGQEAGETADSADEHDG
jgi:large subunit ribosomal protein L10